MADMYHLIALSGTLALKGYASGGSHQRILHIFNKCLRKCLLTTKQFDSSKGDITLTPKVNVRGDRVTPSLHSCCAAGDAIDGCPDAAIMIFIP